MTGAKLRAIRDGLAGVTELLLALLDDLDGDPDIEETGDEHDQGAPEGWRSTSQPFEDAEDDDPGEDADPGEDNGDSEPSLGWTATGRHVGDDDREFDPSEMGEPEDAT